MNSNLKYGLWFLGGVLVGAVGAVAVSRGKLNMKPMVANVLSRGMDLKDAAMAKVETAKENLEDLAAEAREVSAARKIARTKTE